MGRGILPKSSGRSCVRSELMSDRHHLHLQTGPTTRRRGGGRLAVGLLMLGLWLGVLGLSASEQLHQLVHAEAHHVHHECVVTSLTKSQLLFLPELIAAPLAVFAVFPLLVFFGERMLGRADVRLAPARAPPVGFLLQ